ncbi:MAG: prepilin peptidase [Oceanospirillales bacterium LUC14_002_19_P2]|nr:MAG: prepilin peptidase [Oceanospirillales bacterium LUC14_002_19_P2]
MDMLSLLSSSPLLFITLTLILGLLVGSFLNVVIYRLPVMMQADWKQQCQQLLDPDKIPEAGERFNLIVPASTCPSCQHKIRPWENIPVLSYLFLKGRCSQCKTTISPRYPIIETVTGVLSALVAWYFGFTWQALAVLVLTWSLIALTMIDFDHQLLPDSITLPLVWLGLICNSFGLFTTLEAALWGAVAGYLSLWSVYWLFKLVTGKEGMGYGDFKLLAALGAWMGWSQLPVIILLSSLVGAIVGISLILFLGRDRTIPIPFGPYLAAAGLIAMFQGEQLINTYLRFTGL